MKPLRSTVLTLFTLIAPAAAAAPAPPAPAPAADALAGCLEQPSRPEGRAWICAGSMLLTYGTPQELSDDEVSAQLDGFGADDRNARRDRTPFNLEGRPLPSVKVSSKRPGGGAFTVQMIAVKGAGGTRLIVCSSRDADGGRCPATLLALAKKGPPAAAKASSAPAVDPGQVDPAGGSSLTRTVMSNVKRAVVQFRREHGQSCPPGLNELVRAGYLAVAPRDAWGRPLRFTCPADHYPYDADLESPGPDGKLDTADDVRSWDP